MIGNWVSYELTYRKMGGVDTRIAVQGLYADLKADPSGHKFFRSGVNKTQEAINYLETYYGEMLR